MSDVFFDYNLPPDRIAQHPCGERDGSRLLVLNRATGSLGHHRFRDLPELLDPGDLIVLNDTRVVPARLLGRRAATGGKWEGLFLRAGADGTWELIAQSGGRLRAGEWIDIDPGPLRLELIDRDANRHWLARPHPAGDAAELLARAGRIPLPPYIRRGSAAAEDAGRYQTVYAQTPGAVAAPTAGLHFTPALFQRLQERGIEQATVTLHVGLGTFQPIRGDHWQVHRMHRERCELPASTVAAIDACRRRGRRVVAIGTTTVRVLESVAADGPVRAWSGETEIFIHPPFTFRVVDGLVTNFHLPRSTLLLMVGAFAGSDGLREAYRVAIAEEYRFYSYGDAMLIV